MKLGHACNYIDKLDENPDIIASLTRDMEELSTNKLWKLSKLQKNMFNSHFIYQNQKKASDEIISDSIAWGCRGGGSYGSSLILNNCADEYLMKKSFPNVIKAINKYYADSGLVYTIY